MKSIHTKFITDGVNQLLDDSIRGTVTVLSVIVSHLPEDDIHASEMVVHATVAGAVETLESAVNKQKYRLRDKIFYPEVSRLVSKFLQQTDAREMSSNQPVAYVAINSKAEDKQIMSNRKLIFCTLMREEEVKDD